MKVFIISFGTNPRIAAKFRTDRFRTFDENRAGKNKDITANKPYTRRHCFATLDGAASIKKNIKLMDGTPGGVPGYKGGLVKIGK